MKNLLKKLTALILVVTLATPAAYIPAKAEEPENAVQEEVSQDKVTEEEIIQEEVTTEESSTEEENAEEDNDAEPELYEEPSLEETLILEENLTEDMIVEEECTEDATVFDLGDGRKTAIFYSQDVRFEEDGELVDYDPALVKVDSKKTENGESLTGYKYENKAGDSKQYIPEKLGEDNQILMEKDDYSIKMHPVDENLSETEVSLEREEILTAYETVENKKLTAVYESKDKKYSYEYTSLNEGIKETIVLNECPESNIFQFEIKLDGLRVELDAEQNIIILRDEENNMMEAMIDRPFMNDATGEAYSEDLEYALEEQKDGSYLVTLTVSKKYLNSVERVYPVTIDPTATWKGDEKFLDAYVINGSYASTNFYDSDIKIMPVGVGSQGTFRTYFKLPNVKSILEDKYVDSAYLTLYETSSSVANQTIKINRIVENWSPSTLTWNNKPSYYSTTAANSFKTDGDTYASHKVSIRSAIRNFLNSVDNANYGFVLRNTSSSPSYACFLGSRTSSSSYRPKLVVTYYDKPTGFTEHTLSVKIGENTYEATKYVKEGENVYSTWTGISSVALADVQYKVIGKDGTADPESVGEDEVDLTSYRSIGEVSENAENVLIPYISDLPAGSYKLYLRGKDEAGMNGIGKYRSLYVDDDEPTLTDVVIAPASSENEPVGDTTPVLAWNADDTFFSKVTVSIDGGEEQTAVAIAGAGSYTVPEGTIKTSGIHEIVLTCYDKAGRTVSKTLNYYVDVDAPELNVTVIPESSDAEASNSPRPQYFWTTESTDLKSVEILLNGESKEVITDTTVTNYRFAEDVLTESGKYTVSIKAEDTLGNITTQDFDYYLDLDTPVFDSLYLTSELDENGATANRSPVLHWSINDNALESVSYSLDGTNYTVMGSEKNGRYTIPSDVWGAETGNFTIYVKATDKSGFTSDVEILSVQLTEGTNYIPYDLSCTEYYGKRIISWKLDAYDDQTAAYDLHRGTTADFTPSEDTLVQANISAPNCLYMDKEILESGTYYYKIVVRNISTEDAEDYGVSEGLEVANTITMAQFSQTLGQKEYLSYLDMGLPMGNLNIEESSGNLLYSQSDFSVSNSQFDYGLDRSYQSRSLKTSMLGTGWQDSYHRELYTQGSTIYFMDNDGSCYKFILNDENAYECEETKNFALEVTETGYTITTKEHITYTFNQNGQLKGISEPNGCGISYAYDHMGRLAYVISKEDRCSEKKLALSYEGNSYLLNSITDFEGTVYRYTYSDNKLVKSEFGKGNDCISYDYSYNTAGLLTSVADGLDNDYSVTYTDAKAVSMAYPDGEKFTVTYENGSTTIEKYTPSGVKLHEEEITYDSATGKLLTYTDAAGETTTYEYASVNPYLIEKIKSVKSYQTITDGVVGFVNEENGAVTAYTYDTNENLLTSEEADGSKTTYTYEENTSDVKSEVTVKDGKTISSNSYSYDSKGNITTSKDEVNDTKETNVYDSDGNVVEAVVKEDGKTTSVTATAYDEQGNAISESAQSGVVDTTAKAEYDGMGRLVKSVENGVTTTITYDVFGREVKNITKETGKDSITKTKIYNANGTLVKETSTAGVTKDYTYDSRNRLIKEVTSGTGIEIRTSETAYGYQQNLNINTGIGTEAEAISYTTTVKDTSGTVVSISYTDAMGRTVKEVSGTQFTDYVYDRAGNQVATYEGATESSEYVLSLSLKDADGNAFAEVGNANVADGTYVIGDDSIDIYSEYDAYGNVVKETNAMDQVTEYTYDNQGNLIECDIARDGVADLTASYTIQSNGDTFTTVTDANGDIKTELTDASGVTKETTDVDKAEKEELYSSYVYDELGRVTKEIFKDKTYVLYEYEGKSERISKKTTYLVDGTAEDETIYTYDALGRTTKIVHKTGDTVASTYEYTYDVEGNILTESVKYGTESAKVTSYEYDVEGRLTEVAYPASSEIGTISYSYNTYGDLADIKVNGDVIRTYTYDNFARVASIKDYDEPGSSSYIFKAYEYDELGRTVSMVYTEDGNAENILESYAYSYDKNDMIVSETRISNLPETAINETRAYEYDAYGRLIKTTITDHAASDTLSVTTYEYDAVGNRIRMTVDGVSTDYDYNGLGQLTKVDMPDDEIVYTYDARGNQVREENTTDKDVIETEFNVSGQMVSLTKKTNDTVTLTQNNVYDHEGIRISKTEDSVSREYYYCNGGVAYTEDNNTLSVSNIQNVDGSTFATVRDEVYYNYLKNIQGSTSGIVNEIGDTSAVYEYTDFGETEELTGGSFDNEICYTGAIYDKNTGLYYLNARYYDPANARFISQDTYRGEMDDAGTWHLYAYCNNNPINYTDPSGHKWIRFSVIKRRANRNARIAMDKYNNNCKSANQYGGYTKNAISKQENYEHIKFKRTNISDQGCGIVAVHNALFLRKQQKNFLQLVAEFEYNTSCMGAGGILIGTVVNALKSYTKPQYCEDLSTFSRKIRTNTWGIMLYRHSSGAHYVTVRKIRGKYQIYNTNKGVRTIRSLYDFMKERKSRSYTTGYVGK